jgi:two-component system, NarL family, nitrate/nitrite response regulator NarL
MDKPVNILVADNDAIVSELLAGYLSSNGMASTPVSTLGGACDAFSKRDTIDAFLLDMDMPAVASPMQLEHVLKTYGSTPVILMSSSARREVIEHAIDIGARGYIPKSSSLRTLLNAVKFVLAGETFLPASFIASSAERVQFNGVHFNSREIEVLRQVRLGKMNKEIAIALGISPTAVKMTVRTICNKLSVKNRTQAALLASDFLPD